MKWYYLVIIFLNFIYSSLQTNYIMLQKKKKKHLTLLYFKFLPYHFNSKTNQRQETITIIVRLLSQRGESNQNKQSSTDETMDPLRANNDRKPPNNLVNWPPTHAINRHLPNFRKETRWERVNHRGGKKGKSRCVISFLQGRLLML